MILIFIFHTIRYLMNYVLSEFQQDEIFDDVGKGITLILKAKTKTEKVDSHADTRNKMMLLFS